MRGEVAHLEKEIHTILDSLSEAVQQIRQIYAAYVRSSQKEKLQNAPIRRKRTQMMPLDMKEATGDCLFQLMSENRLEGSPYAVGEQELKGTLACLREDSKKLLARIESLWIGQPVMGSRDPKL